MYISKARLKSFVKNLWYLKDEYGFEEMIIERTIFRFWVYPSYWRYLLTKILVKFNIWQPKVELKDNRRRYLTGCVARNAGIGHQLANWNTILVFSNKFNLNLVHQPLTSDWEKFLDFGDGELLYEEVVKDQPLKRVILPRIRWTREEDRLGHHIIGEIISSAYPGSDILFHLSSDHVHPNVHDHTSTSEILRRKYWKTRSKKPISSDFNGSKLNVACHIRRGDILTLNKQDKNFKKRWLDNTYFLKIIRKIKSVITDKDVDIHIFSQGSLSDFSDFSELENVIYHLDENQYKTFHSIIVADVLILSPSSFSYKAGIISKGIKIANYPWWHYIPENFEWIRSDDNGNFDVCPLIERLGRL